MPKSQVSSLAFILLVTGLLTILFTWIFLFVLFWICVCNATLLLTVFFLYLLFLLIRILLLRPYESILKTLDSYQNHDD